MPGVMFSKPCLLSAVALVLLTLKELEDIILFLHMVFHNNMCTVLDPVQFYFRFTDVVMCMIHCLTIVVLH